MDYRIKYYDKEGNPIRDVTDWAPKLEDREYARVGYYKRPWVFVSTVWLGLDHNFSDKGPPLIFETMVFGPHCGDVDMKRYATLKEAEKGHEAFVKRYRWRVDLWLRRRRI